MILSVKKAMDIMDRIAAKGRMSVKELSRELEMPKSTVCRLAQTLVDSGYLEQDLSNEDYLLSYKFFRAGYDILEKNGVRSCVLPVIKHLSELTDKTVNFTILDEAEVLFIEKIERSPIYGGIKLGARAPLHCTASGKVMLANLASEQLNTVLGKVQPMKEYTNQTIVTVEALFQELSDVREKGYAKCIDELGNGVNAIAAYVEGYPGRKAAAVSVAGPQNILEDEKFAELSQLVMTAAKEISRCFQAF